MCVSILGTAGRKVARFLLKDLKDLRLRLPGNLLKDAPVLMSQRAEACRLKRLHLARTNLH
jgi:hypothetical protein